MTENRPQNVTAAFEMLLEKIEAEVDFVTGSGARALETRSYEQAQEALTRAGRITVLRDRVAALRKEWQTLESLGEQMETHETKAERQNLGRLRKGLRTPEEDYWIPILSTLVEMGGSGAVSEVFDRVFAMMKSQLNKFDLLPLASDPGNPRWRNAGQWARNSMVNEGLIRDDSPRGVWAISEAGRQWLRGAGNDEQEDRCWTQLRPRTRYRRDGGTTLASTPTWWVIQTKL